MAPSTRQRRVWDFLRSQPSWVWQVLAPIVALAVFAWMWWKLPPWLYRHVADNATQVKAITDTRTALLAGLVGLGAICTFWLNSRVYKITARTFQLTEQGHITERYTKAIEQLGADKLDIRLGGIYALERIATTRTETTRRSSRSSAPSSRNTATRLVDLAGGFLLPATIHDRRRTYKPRLPY